LERFYFLQHGYRVSNDCHSGAWRSHEPGTHNQSFCRTITVIASEAKQSRGDAHKGWIASLRSQ
jgi:hypothetical protein